MTSHEWSIILNILKLAGVIIVGISGVLGIVQETKTPDKARLTPAGHLLLRLGTIGFLVAVGAQCAEWFKGEREENERQAQTMKLLSEIRRSLTRFETIDADVKFGLPLNAQELQPYLRRLRSSVARLNEQETDLKVGENFEGIRVISRHTGAFPFNDILRIDPQSPALPQRQLASKRVRDDGDAAEFCNETPSIAFFREPLDDKSLTKFVSFGLNPPQPDIEIKPVGGRVTMTIVQNDDSQITGIEQERSLATAPSGSWRVRSERVLSLEDLAGSEVVVYMPYPLRDPTRALWNQTYTGIVLYVNHRQFFPMLKRRQNAGDVFYTYMFPKGTAPPNK